MDQAQTGDITVQVKEEKTDKEESKEGNTDAIKEIAKETSQEKEEKKKPEKDSKQQKKQLARASTLRVYRDIEKENENVIEGELKELKSDAAAATKFLVLVQELHKSLIPCLVATPFVYLGNSWMLYNHADFKMQKRKALEKILNEHNSGSQDFFKMLDEFELILIDVLKVRFPAMPELYENDEEYFRISAKQASEDLIDRTKTGKILTFRSRVRELGNILVQWFTYCPVGRPLVYVSDVSWELVSENSLRATYRKVILR